MGKFVRETSVRSKMCPSKLIQFELFSLSGKHILVFYEVCSYVVFVVLCCVVLCCVVLCLLPYGQHSNSVSNTPRFLCYIRIQQIFQTLCFIRLRKLIALENSHYC